MMQFLREYPPEGGYMEGMSVHGRYHSWAATQYREKVCVLRSNLGYRLPTLYSSLRHWKTNRGHPRLHPRLSPRDRRASVNPAHQPEGRPHPALRHLSRMKRLSRQRRCLKGAGTGGSAARLSRTTPRPRRASCRQRRSRCSREGGRSSPAPCRPCLKMWSGQAWNGWRIQN